MQQIKWLLKAQGKFSKWDTCAHTVYQCRGDIRHLKVLQLHKILLKMHLNGLVLDEVSQGGYKSQVVINMVMNFRFQNGQGIDCFKICFPKQDLLHWDYHTHTHTHTHTYIYIYIHAFIKFYEIQLDTWIRTAELLKSFHRNKYRKKYLNMVYLQGLYKS
jgi:hypothetical protein